MTQAFIDLGIENGVWRGLFTGTDAPPALTVFLDDRALDAPEVSPADEEGEWHVSVTLPSTVLASGTRTIVLALESSDAPLASFTVTAGPGADSYITAEVSLLRAELDLLKRAFRRHCREQTRE